MDSHLFSRKRVLRNRSIILESAIGAAPPIALARHALSTRPDIRRCRNAFFIAGAASAIFAGNRATALGPPEYSYAVSGSGNWNSTNAWNDSISQQTGTAGVPAMFGQVYVGGPSFSPFGTGVANTVVNFNYAYGATGLGSLNIGNGNELLQTDPSSVMAVNGFFNQFTDAPAAYIGYLSAQDRGSYVQSAGSALFTYLYVGYEGSGTYQISGGTASTTSNIYITSQAGTKGELDVSGGTFQTYSGGIYVAGGGTNVVNQSGGAVSTISLITVGNTSSSPGTGLATYSLSNTGSVNAASLQIGGNGTFQQTGGTVSISGSLSIGAASGPAAYNLSGGALMSNSATSNGQFIQSGGTAGLGALTGSGTVTLGGAAEITTVRSLQQANVTINSGGHLVIASNSTPLNFTNRATSLTITGSGQLELNNQRLFTNSSPSTIEQYLTNGYNAGNWNGTSATGGSITSVSAFNDKTGATSVGYGSSADFTFSGSTSPYRTGGPMALGSGQMVIQQAIPGDLLLTGTVGPNELSIMLNSYGTTGNNWAGGNIDYDPAGSVGPNDLALLLASFGHSSSGFAGASAKASAKPLTSSAKPSLVASVSDIGPPPADGIELLIDPGNGHVELLGNNATLVTSVVLTSPANGLIGNTTFTPSFTALFNTSASNTNGLIDQFNTFTNGSAVNGLFDMGYIYNTIQDSLDVQFQFSEKGVNRGNLQTGLVVYFDPEPASLSLLALATTGLLGRRRKLKAPK